MTGAKSILGRLHADEEQDRKILRQDLQALQDEFRHTELSPIGEGLFLMPYSLFHPVNPVNPVKIPWKSSQHGLVCFIDS
jgi:hypothetical protein